MISSLRKPLKCHYPAPQIQIRVLTPRRLALLSLQLANVLPCLLRRSIEVGRMLDVVQIMLSLLDVMALANSLVALLALSMVRKAPQKSELEF